MIKKWMAMTMVLLLLLTGCAKEPAGKAGATEEEIQNVKPLKEITRADYLAAKDGRLVTKDDLGDVNIILFNPLLSSGYEELEEQAKGTKVTFYGWGGDEDLNHWLKNYYVPLMKKEHDITVEIVPMNIDDILSQISGELQGGKAASKNENDASGTVDMVWINGENFKSAKENQMLLEDFAWKLPNVEQFIDQQSPGFQRDFGYPIDGSEVPYGEAQMVFYNDAALSPETPKNTQELLEYVKKYPGKVTYPALPDFTGSAFVRNIIYDIVGHEDFVSMEPDKEVVKQAIKPALDYLKQLNPYLWNQGKTFPSALSQLENMYGDKELYMGMSYAAYGVALNIENGRYSPTTKTFFFDKGTVGNTNYIAIPVNSPNKAGAIVAINAMISPKVQLDRFQTLRTLPVVDYQKLSAEEKQAFDKVDLGKGVLPQDELQSKKLPEMAAQLIPIIEEIWLEEVVGK